MRLFLLLLAPAAFALPATIQVAQDGTGQYRTVQEAIDSAPSNGTERFIIHIKPGVYRERVAIPHNKRFITLLGDDPGTTILSWDLYAAVEGPDHKPIGTFRTPSAIIEADDFRAENLTFENSAGPKGQAVALAIMGDLAVFRNCRFLGWQDTLLAQTGRQYFENCYIEGAVDFIFGGSTAYFERCHIHVRGNGYITAASTPKDQPYGYVFHRCTITGEPSVRTFLGRPWRDYGSATFLDTEMSEVVRPEGWNNWQKPERESTARYAEYGSTGPGADWNARVAWARKLNTDEASRLAMDTVLGGADGWNPETGSFKAIAWTIPPDAREKMETPNVENGHIVWLTHDQRLASGTTRLDIMAGRNALSVGHPSVYYDRDRKQFIVSFAATIRDNYFQSYEEPVEDNPRLWYTTTQDFETFSAPKILFEPGYAVRYGVILLSGNRYALLHEDSRRAIQMLRVSFSESPTGPWGPPSDPIGEGFHQRVKIALAGDSTVAEAGGWGPGFREAFGPDVQVLNFARNGRSSKSFRDEGQWDPVLAANADYVLIQFGHNDVPGKGPDRETDAATTYRANLIRFAEEVRAQGGIPVLATSIVRRNLTPDGKVKPDSLAAYVEEVRKISTDFRADLYARTKEQCEGLGPAGCHQLDAVTAEGNPDTTHLGALGRREIGGIAAREFLKTVLPGQASADPSSVTANTLLPANARRSTYSMPARRQPPSPAVILIGDSTVRNGRGVGVNGLWGWGDALPEEFAKKMEVINRAIPGLSSRTYVTQGHWSSTLALLRTGDTLVMQFGHNDESPLNDPTRARGSIRGDDEETVEIYNQMTGEPETVHTYGWYLRRMISEARAKGVHVIVCSPVPRNRWKGGRIQRTQDYPELAHKVAAATGARFLDLNELVARRYQELGVDAVRKFFPGDNTHTTREGAELTGRIFADAIAALVQSRH
jgi:pectinesterase